MPWAGCMQLGRQYLLLIATQWKMADISCPTAWKWFCLSLLIYLFIRLNNPWPTEMTAKIGFSHLTSLNGFLCIESSFLNVNLVCIIFPSNHVKWFSGAITKKPDMGRKKMHLFTLYYFSLVSKLYFFFFPEEKSVANFPPFFSFLFQEY